MKRAADNYGQITSPEHAKYLKRVRENAKHLEATVVNAAVGKERAKMAKEMAKKDKEIERLKKMIKE